MNRAGRDTLALLDYQLRKQNVTVEQSFDPDAEPVWGREPAIRGIWMNLCLNAMQAMPAGGALRVRSQEQGQSVVFEVSDTGPGISPLHLDRIWDPFFTTKPPGVGTGLGLSITQRAVHRHSGTIQVESQPGRGARFTVELPHHGAGGQGG